MHETRHKQTTFLENKIFLHHSFKLIRRPIGHSYWFYKWKLLLIFTYNKLAFLTNYFLQNKTMQILWIKLIFPVKLWSTNDYNWLPKTSICGRLFNSGLTYRVKLTIGRFALSGKINYLWWSLNALIDYGYDKNIWNGHMSGLYVCGRTSER